MKRSPGQWVVQAVMSAALAGGCGHGGGQNVERSKAGRAFDASQIAVPAGYAIELVAQGLTYPTGIVFDAQSTPVVVESGYSYGEDFTVPRLVRLEPGGSLRELARGEDNGPWNGVDFSDHHFFISEGGERKGGRILKVSPEGKTTVLADGLPSQGDHHTNGPVVHDGWVYFGQGTTTNAAVVGEDNAKFGWLKRQPQVHDVPCADVTLLGKSFETDNPLTEESGDRAKTGPYLPFGTAATEGQVIPGRVPCNGAILRVRTSGGAMELVAWGFRNPFGLAFGPNGRLYATDNGYDQRGSRPVFGAADMLWEVEPGRWYGWPDYSEGRRLTLDRFKEGKGPPPGAVLRAVPSEPPKPKAFLAVHSSSDGFDFSKSERFGFVGQAFIAQFGDQAPTVGKVRNPVGFKVVRVDPATGVIADFAINPGKQNGPASLLESGGLERPIAARFSPEGTSLYVVDFGVLAMDDKGSHPRRGTGCVWRIVRR
jgi:glucose/arabinose dehydrogenase